MNIPNQSPPVSTYASQDAREAALMAKDAERWRAVRGRIGNLVVDAALQLGDDEMRGTRNDVIVDEFIRVFGNVK